MIDSHCHLDHEPLFKNLKNVILNSKNEGVEKILTICTTKESFISILELVKYDKIIYGTYGIHPHETKENILSIQNIVDTVERNNRIIGVGETGLDFYYNNSDKSVQKKSFIEHIKASSILNITLIVHTRNEATDTYDILKSEKKNSDLKVLIHCFTGSKDFSNKLLDINCYISVSGIITFKNSIELSNTVADIPLENLLVETDSPYLSPVPYRGKANDPSYIVHTIKRLSEIKKISNEEVIKFTSNNFKKLFNIK